MVLLLIQYIIPWLYLSGIKHATSRENDLPAKRNSFTPRGMAQLVELRKLTGRQHRLQHHQVQRETLHRLPDT
jgi:hypothetical protein